MTLENQPQEIVAQRLQTSINTVRVLISQAKHELRLQYRRYKKSLGKAAA